MSRIHFESNLEKIDSLYLFRFPKSASATLPSRGMVLVEGNINDSHFRSVLEPDGKGSHWLAVDKGLLDAIHGKVGDAYVLDVAPAEDWPEPTIPSDLLAALTTATNAHTLWKNITPMARWDWIRWIRSTKQPETRKRRIEVAISKLKAGTRRPCCFNRTMCTVPDVSNNGVLFEAM